jgi:preprotein translocase subunit YajC
MSSYLLWIPLIVLVGWFMIVRPQRNARRKALELESSLEVGDEVVTIGGLYGYIVTIDEREVELDVADGVTLRFARRAIAHKAPEQDDEVDDDEVDDDEDHGGDEHADDGEPGDDDEVGDNFEHEGTSHEVPVIDPAPNADESSGR